MLHAKQGQQAHEAVLFAPSPRTPSITTTLQDRQTSVKQLQQLSTQRRDTDFRSSGYQSASASTISSPPAMQYLTDAPESAAASSAEDPQAALISFIADLGIMINEIGTFLENQVVPIISSVFQTPPKTQGKSLALTCIQHLQKLLSINLDTHIAKISAFTSQPHSSIEEFQQYCDETAIMFAQTIEQCNGLINAVSPFCTADQEHILAEFTSLVHNCIVSLQFATNKTHLKIIKEHIRSLLTSLQSLKEQLPNFSEESLREYFIDDEMFPQEQISVHVGDKLSISQLDATQPELPSHHAAKTPAKYTAARSQDLANKQRLAEAADEELEELHREKQQQTEKIKCLESQIYELERKNSSLQNEADLLRERSNGPQQSSSRRQSLATAPAQNDNLIEQFQKELAEKQQLIERLEIKIEDISKTHSQDKLKAEATTGELTKENQKLALQIRTLEQSIQTLEQRVTDLEDELSTKTKNNDSLNAEIEQLKALLEAAQKDSALLAEAAAEKHPQGAQHKPNMTALSASQFDGNRTSISMAIGNDGLNPISARSHFLARRYAPIITEKQGEDGSSDPFDQQQEKLSAQEFILTQIVKLCASFTDTIDIFNKFIGKSDERQKIKEQITSLENTISAMIATNAKTPIPNKGILSKSYDTQEVTTQLSTINMLTETIRSNLKTLKVEQDKTQQNETELNTKLNEINKNIEYFFETLEQFRQYHQQIKQEKTRIIPKEIFPFAQFTVTDVNTLNALFQDPEMTKPPESLSELRNTLRTTTPQEHPTISCTPAECIALKEFLQTPTIYLDLEQNRHYNRHRQKLATPTPIRAGTLYCQITKENSIQYFFLAKNEQASEYTITTEDNPELTTLHFDATSSGNLRSFFDSIKKQILEIAVRKGHISSLVLDTKKLTAISRLSTLFERPTNPELISARESSLAEMLSENKPDSLPGTFTTILSSINEMLMITNTRLKEYTARSLLGAHVVRQALSLNITSTISSHFQKTLPNASSFELTTQGMSQEITNAFFNIDQKLIDELLRLTTDIQTKLHKKDNRDTIAQLTETHNTLTSLQALRDFMQVSNTTHDDNTQQKTTSQEPNALQKFKTELIQLIMNAENIFAAIIAIGTAMEVKINELTNIHDLREHTDIRRRYGNLKLFTPNPDSVLDCLYQSLDQFTNNGTLLSDTLLPALEALCQPIASKRESPSASGKSTPTGGLAATANTRGAASGPASFLGGRSTPPTQISGRSTPTFGNQ